MTANPIQEKYHASDPVLGLPAMDRVQNENPDRPHNHYLAMLGKVSSYNSARGDHSGKAMFVEFPADAVQGQWMVLNGDDFTVTQADGTAKGRVGVAMASVNPAINIGPRYFGWIAVEGRVTALVGAGVAAGSDLFFDSANPGVAAAAGTSQILGVVAYSAPAVADETVADPDTVPEYDTGYGEVYLQY